MPRGEQIAKPAERASRLAGSCFLGLCQEALCDSLHAVRRASPSACFSPAVANPTSPSPRRATCPSSAALDRVATGEGGLNVREEVGHRGALVCVTTPS